MPVCCAAIRARLAASSCLCHVLFSGRGKLELQSSFVGAGWVLCDPKNSLFPFVKSFNTCSILAESNPGLCKGFATNSACSF